MARRPRGPVVNRRHVARLEREHQQTNYIKISTIVIVVMVVVLVGAGLFYDRVIVANQPVATVKGGDISTREFQARVRYERNSLVNRYYQTYQTAQAFGTDAQFMGFFQNSLNQIELQLTPDSLGRDVLNVLIEERILRLKAAEMGIMVSEEEIQERLEEFYGFYNGEQPPTPTEVPTTRPTSTLTAQQMTLMAPTATVTATTTVTSTTPITATEATPVVEATAIPTATQVIDGPTPTATTIPPTATPYSQEAFDTDYKDSIKGLKSNLGFSEEDLRYMIESQILREKLLEVIAAEVAVDQDQVWARHILVGDEATANEVLARLNAGEDFAALAAEYSTDTSNASSGGDLGWFGIGQMALEFEKVAFNTPVGEISEPTQTTFGWHIIQVLGHELRALSATEFEQARQDAFDGWLSQQRQLFDTDIVFFDYWESRVPDDPTIQHIDLQTALGAPTTDNVTATPAP